MHVNATMMTSAKNTATPRDESGIPENADRAGPGRRRNTNASASAAIHRALIVESVLAITAVEVRDVRPSAPRRSSDSAHRRRYGGAGAGRVDCVRRSMAGSYGSVQMVSARRARYNPQRMHEPLRRRVSPPVNAK